MQRVRDVGRPLSLPPSFTHPRIYFLFRLSARIGSLFLSSKRVIKSIIPAINIKLLFSLSFLRAKLLGAPLMALLSIRAPLSKKTPTRSRRERATMVAEAVAVVGDGGGGGGGAGGGGR